MVAACFHEFIGHLRQLFGGSVTHTRTQAKLLLDHPTLAFVTIYPLFNTMALPRGFDRDLRPVVVRGGSKTSIDMD